MAARTFTSAGVNNLWSNPANWDGGVAVPANNDSVTIPSGQTCEFDVDQSGFADGIDGLTITGTLKLTRTAGTYYLKIKAAKTITGAGIFDCGTAVSIIPFTAKHTMGGGAGLHTFTMTDSVDTWESDLWTYTNSGTEDVTLVVRIQGMNATGNLYSALDVEQINVDLTGAIAKIDVIDGLVDAIKAKTDQLAFTVANQVDSNSLTGAGTPADVVTALMAEVVEGTYTYKDILHIIMSVLAGKSSGGGTANIKFRDLGDTKDRVDATVDANGNRLSITLDGS